MRLLLDSHVLIWAAATPERLSSEVQDAISDPGNVVLVSAASIWEIAIKRALGRIDFPVDELAAVLDEMGMATLPISTVHAITAGGLPRHHNDPFDRMLIAQAKADALTLVSADTAMRAYDIPFLPAT